MPLSFSGEIHVESLLLNRLYNTALSDKKKISLFNLFQIRPENQSAFLP